MQNQNYNQPYKERGIKVGSKIRCFNLISGNKQDGSMWGYFNYVEKDSNKNPIQKYNVWIKNADVNFIANFPSGQVDVNIKEIQAVRPENKSYTKRDGTNVRERVINIDVVVEIATVWGGNNQQNGYQPPVNNQQQTNYQQNYNSLPNEYDDIDIENDDLPF